MRTQEFVFAGALALLLVGTSPVFAQGNGRGRGRGHNKDMTTPCNLITAITDTATSDIIIATTATKSMTGTSNTSAICRQA